MKILHSTSSVPSENAALEEYLYRSAEGETLLFYDNCPSVVIGRNQNPWKEADLDWCGRNGVQLARRISGGGAVYHDQGNLNYAYFVPRADFDPGRTVGRLAEVLAGLGIPRIRQDEHHSIFAGDRKVSGSAFALNSQRAMIHGCILVSTDLDVLARSLRGMPGVRFQSSSVDSRKVPVANLSEFLPGLSPADLKDILAEGKPSQAIPLPDDDLLQRFESPDWLYGRTPPFQAHYEDGSPVPQDAFPRLPSMGR